MKKLKTFESYQLNEFDRDDVNARIYHDLRNSINSIPSVKKFDYTNLDSVWVEMKHDDKNWKTDLKKIEKLITGHKFGKDFKEVPSGNPNIHEFSE